MGRKAWAQAEKHLKLAKVPYRSYMTEYKGHAAKIAADITSPQNLGNEPATIVVLGGDGTLNEVLNGLRISPNISLCYIPSGSGGDFARAMGLKKAPVKALENIISTGSFRYLDYGVVTYADTHPVHKRFIVSSGIGYDAAVCENINRTKLKKVFNRLHMGKIAYLCIGIKQIVQSKPSNGYIILDGTRRINLRNIRFISSHIHKYEGGGFAFAPKADPSDGKMDLCVVACPTRLRFTLILLASLIGKHNLMGGANIYRCSEAEIHTEIPLFVHTDGEIPGKQTDIYMHCETGKLRFIC